MRRVEDLNLTRWHTDLGRDFTGWKTVPHLKTSLPWLNEMPAGILETYKPPD
jgi:hypothetical protein